MLSFAGIGANLLFLGLSSDFSYTDVARIGEVHVADMPIARRTLRSKLETMMPMLARRTSRLRTCLTLQTGFHSTHKVAFGLEPTARIRIPEITRAKAIIRCWSAIP